MGLKINVCDLRLASVVCVIATMVGMDNLYNYLHPVDYIQTKAEIISAVNVGGYGNDDNIKWYYQYQVEYNYTWDSTHNYWSLGQTQIVIPVNQTLITEIDIEYYRIIPWKSWPLDGLAGRNLYQKNLFETDLTAYGAGGWLIIIPTLFLMLCFLDLCYASGVNDDHPCRGYCLALKLPNFKKCLLAILCPMAPLFLITFILANTWVDLKSITSTRVWANFTGYTCSEDLDVCSYHYIIQDPTNKTQYRRLGSSTEGYCGYDKYFETLKNYSEALIVYARPYPISDASPIPSLNYPNDYQSLFSFICFLVTITPIFIRCCWCCMFTVERPVIENPSDNSGEQHATWLTFYTSFKDYLWTNNQYIIKKVDPDNVPLTVVAGVEPDVEANQTNSMNSDQSASESYSESDGDFDNEVEDLTVNEAITSEDFSENEIGLINSETGSADDL